MNHYSVNKPTYPSTTYIIFLSVMLVVSMFLLKGNINLNLGDEGHLWYGAIQTAQGAVPILDFRSYDPGRYYWTAGWSQILGSGLISLRISNALFQIIGLALGLLAISRIITNRLLLVLIGLLFIVWMYPWYKLYEHSLALAAVYFALLLTENPSIKRHFIAGVLVGISAFFGRNYGVYFFISFLSLIIFIRIKSENDNLLNKLGIWLSGIVTGYLPMFVMIIFIPGFLNSFVESVRLIFSPGAPVLPTPIPWPWTLKFSSLTSLDDLRTCVISLMFILIPVFYLWSVIYFFRSRLDLSTPGARLTVASVFIGIPLMHHAAVRSGFPHLAQSIHPFLITLIALPFALNEKHRTWVASGSAVLILIMTLTTIVPTEAVQAVKKFQALNSDESSIVSYKLVEDSVWIPKHYAKYIELIREFAERNLGENENILIAPYEPGLYPILGKTSPTWDPYPLFPAKPEHQRQIIISLHKKNVKWALISNKAMDGMSQRRFSNTHNIVWQYLMDNYEVVKLPGLPRDSLLLHKI
ncbi:hypothetical protein [Thiolapillus brandeum]|uniref:Glycosyltransferase RgtA/B/C/D-like domain-containing protein n=1 Tax=Thiolapillus brandeum TaxID=1076588 RepID=A0A7U6GKH1_9GAMM|nr:hypothetical protein [Thiolapillus brandeum]BAO45315.1 conserved hypothetical protein [Thiolapillus brandeum]